MPLYIHTKLVKVTSISGDHRVSFFILRSLFFAAHLSLLLLCILSISEALLKILWSWARKCGNAIFSGVAAEAGKCVFCGNPVDGTQDPTEPKPASSLWLGRLSLAFTGTMWWKKELLWTLWKRRRDMNWSKCRDFSWNGFQVVSGHKNKSYPGRYEAMFFMKNPSNGGFWQADGQTGHSRWRQSASFKNITT